MTRTGWRTAAASLATAIALLLGATAFADQVTLSDGRVLEGRIVLENDREVKLELSRGGAITVPRKDVRSIERGKSNLDRLEERLGALHPGRPEAYVEAGAWCLGEMKREDLGVRLVATGMALDSRCIVRGGIVLGDYFLQTRRDRSRAAYWYVRALLAAPHDPECNRRFDSVKDATDQVLVADDRLLLDGLQAYRRGDWSEAATALGAGRRSAHRARVEERLNQRVDALTAYARSRVACRGCQGSRSIPCSPCRGVGSLPCPACFGTGNVERTSPGGTGSAPCAACHGTGKTPCPRCRPANPPERDPRATPTPPAGQVPCPTCKGRTAAAGFGAAPVQPAAVDAAVSYLQQRVGSGAHSLHEQGNTRMLFVGGAVPLDGAEEFAATPLWLGDRWGPADAAAVPDPKAQEQERAAAEWTDALRGRAEPLQPSGGAAESFLERLRGTFGAGTVSGAVAQSVRVTEFGTLLPDPGAGTVGAHAAFDPATGLLRPILVQWSRTYSTTRVTLADAGAEGIAVPRRLEFEQAMRTPGAVVRIYYSVVDAREEVLPEVERDICIYQLTVKCLLLDVLDADGRILLSAR